MRDSLDKIKISTNKSAMEASLEVRKPNFTVSFRKHIECSRFERHPRNKERREMTFFPHR